jgi:hypothetical protein
MMKTVLLGLLAALVALPAGTNVYGTYGDGVHDDLPAILARIAAQRGGKQTIELSHGTYAISDTLVLPSRFTLTGVGRGDFGAWNTTLVALPNFPVGHPLVSMGDEIPSFGVQIKNLTLDGNNRAGVCLTNSNSEELSYAQDVLLTRCVQGLTIIGSGAQQSGPFRNLEIYPYGGATANCVVVQNAPGFRGIQGLTCNGFNAPGQAVGLLIDGGSLYEDMHIERVGTGVQLGSNYNTADGTVLTGLEMGPQITTGIKITSRDGNQNVTIIGSRCAGCGVHLEDDVMHIVDAHYSVGFYALGDGAGTSKTLIQNGQGVH